MRVQILELIEGAKKAEGLTVIIDVFRAFTTECYCFAGGAVKSYPIGSMEDAFALKREHPDWVLLGERGGAKVEGCDLGNSPWDAMNYDFRGKTMIHSTSAGTQGIVNAARASATQIITGSLVTAKAICDYIHAQHKPETVEGDTERIVLSRENVRQCRIEELLPAVILQVFDPSVDII